MATAVQPNSLGNSQKKVNETFGTSGRPTRYKVISSVRNWHIINQVHSIADRRPPHPAEQGVGHPLRRRLRRGAQDAAPRWSPPRQGRRGKVTPAGMTVTGLIVTLTGVTVTDRV